MAGIIGNINGVPVMQYDDGTCWIDYGNGIAEPVNCSAVQPLATRPRVVSPSLSTSNPFGVMAYPAGNLATVTVRASQTSTARTNYTALIVVAAALGLLLLKK